MDLQVISTEHKFYKVDVDALCHILLQLFPENLRRIHPAPVSLAGLHGNVQAPIDPTPWGLATSHVDSRVVGLKIRVPGGEEIVVTGPAEGMRERCKRALAGRNADLPSDELIQQYAATTA